MGQQPRFFGSIGDTAKNILVLHGGSPSTAAIRCLEEHHPSVIALGQFIDGSVPRHRLIHVAHVFGRVDIAVKLGKERLRPTRILSVCLHYLANHSTCLPRIFNSVVFI